MAFDPNRNDDSLFDPSGDPFDNSGFGDPFANPSSSYSPVSDNGSDFFSGAVDGFDSVGSDGVGGGGGRPPHRLPPLPILLAVFVVASLLGLILLSRAFTPEPVSVSLATDMGEIFTTVTEQQDGTYRVLLRHEKTDLDPSQFYIAGFMMAPEGESLVAVGEPVYITAATSYTATTELIITRPGTYSLAFYSYSLLNPIPSITRTSTLALGDESLPPSFPSGSPFIVVTPSPSPLPTPAPTAPPPDATPSPADMSRKLRPDSDVFDLYDVSTRHYYHLLTDEQKTVFSEIYDGIVKTQTNISLTRCSINDYEMAMNAIRFDCPELFLLDYEKGWSYTYDVLDRVTAVDFDGSYTLSASSYRTQLDQIMDTIRSFVGLPGFGSSDYSKELAISNYIIDHSVYDLSLPRCAYADSVYLYGYAKCTGYTHAFNLALRYYGIPCTAIVGNTYDNGVISPTGHMWSLVQIDGQWYHCDATWNDQDGMDLYPYFNVNDRLMFSARTLEISSQKAMRFPLPQCTSLSQNFAMKEGVFIPAGANVTESVASTVADVWDAGEEEVIFLFESGSDLSTAVIQIQNQSIVDRISQIIRARYSYTWSLFADVNTLIFSIHSR